MVRQWNLPNYFASKTQKISLRYYFLSGIAIKNSSGQMRQISRRMEKIYPTIGWRRDEHGTQIQAHGSWIFVICITCSFENNAFSVLHYFMVALHYSMLHRFEIFPAPGTIAHGSIRLPHRSLASSRGCSLVTICDEETNNDVTTAVLFDMTSAPVPLKPGVLNKVFYGEVLNISFLT